MDSARIEALLEASEEPLLLLEGHEVVAANEAAEALLGDGVVGSRVGTHFAAAHAASLVDSGEPTDATLTLAGPSARTVQVRLRGPADARVVRLRTIADDTRSALYRALFEVNPAVKLLIEPETGRIVDANPAAAGLYRYSQDELRGMRIQQINTMDDDALQAVIMQVRKADRTAFRFEHQTKDGELQHVEVHTGPVTINGRDLLLSIVFDVTERQRVEAKLALAHRLETVGRLAGGIAHDFNNLLTVLMTSCTVIDRLLPEDSPARTHFGDVERTAQRAAELTRQLLAFSRRQALENERIDLTALVSEMAGLLERTLGADIELHIDLEPSPPILADAGQLEQVFLNLALNARDAMPGGGRLQIRSGERTLDEPTMALERGRYAYFEIEDNGEGMTEETRTHLFEPFYSTKADGGSGLGLATAYGIVRQSGGDVEVRSRLGVGSVMTVLLPVFTGVARARRAPEPTPPTALFAGLRRVLVVEDRDDVRDAMIFGLRTSGFQVEGASSADEALARDDLESFEACVSDVRMPGTSGLQLAETLRLVHPRMGLLLVSGDLHQHARGGVPATVSLLAKPFSGEQLARALLKAIKSAERAASAAGTDAT